MKKVLSLLLLLVASSSIGWAADVSATFTVATAKCTSGNDQVVTAGIPAVFEQNGVIISIDKKSGDGNKPGLYDGNHFRIYKNTIFSVKIPAGSVIKSIVFVISGTYNGNLNPEVGTYSSTTNTWTADVNKPIDILNFTGAATFRCLSATITYENNEKPTTPTIAASPSVLDDFITLTNIANTQKITVGGVNLTTDITLSIAGTDAQYFTVTPSSLSQASGIVADTEVAVAYTPTVAGSHVATLTLSSTGAPDVTYALKGTATMPVLATAVATAATQITKNSFTANWNAVANATSYELSVLKASGTQEIVCLNEDFNACAGKGGNDDRWSGDIATTNLPSSLSGWSIVSGKAASGCVKAGAGSSQGSITTPALAKLNGSATLTFRAGAWAGDATELLLSIIDGGTLSVSSVALVDSQFSTYTVEISNGTANSKIKFEGKQASKARFFLDDVKVTSSGITYTPIADSPFTVTTNAMEVTGLEGGTSYAYSVIAKATGYIDSEASNTIMVNTTDAQVDVDTNLGGILDNGIDNVFYKMNLPLSGMYATGEYLYVKTENAVCAHPSEDPNPGQDYWADKAEDFDQSDWMALKIANPNDYVGKTFDAGLVGKYIGTESTPTLEVANVDVAVNPISVTPNKNEYVVRNILGKCANNPADHDVFVVQAKINEFAQFAASIIKENGEYFLSSQDGKVAIDNSLGFVTDSHLTSSQFMQLDGVLKTRNKVTTGGTSLKAIPDTKEYVVLVTKVPQIATSVEGVGSDKDNTTTVVGGNGIINITTVAGVAVNVFDIAGKIVRNVVAADSQMTIEIPAGIYFVKVGNNASKVIVK